MPQVSLPKDFFIKELECYSRWSLAFWRELFQNAVDAGAKNITVTIDEIEGGWRVGFDDDGCGMDRRCLEEVYFRLGASTKSGAGQVGGFGRARIITCFAQQRYRIETRGLEVIGDGADFEIFERDDRRKGCFLEIDVDRNLAGAESLIEALYLYLGKSDIRTAITINAKPYRGGLHRGRRLRDLVHEGKVFATMNGNKSSHLKGTLVVRVSGAMMYERRTSADALVVVEIMPEISRDVLTASRDSLRWKYDDVLSTFLDELAADKRSALRESHQSSNSVLEGAGFFASGVARKEKADEEVAEDEGRTTASSSWQAPVAPTLRRAPLVVSEPAVPETSPIANLYFYEESGSAKMARLAARFDARKWNPALFSDPEAARRFPPMKLLAAWTAACSAAVGAYVRLTGIEEVLWAPGWYFTSIARAGHRRLGEGHTLLLNPLDDKGRLFWKLSKNEDRRQLLALACHEATHIGQSHHDEDFSALLTQVFGKLDQAAGLRGIQAAMTDPLDSLKARRLDAGD